MTDAPSRTRGSVQVVRARWTPFEAERVSELWRAGATPREIADALDKSCAAVLCKAARLGLRRANTGKRRRRDRAALRAAVQPARSRAWPWTRERQARLVGYWDEGLSTEEIAARLGCAEAEIVDRASRTGLAAVEAPERHVSPGWFARNNARFCAAMQRAVDRGLVCLPDDVESPSRRTSHGEVDHGR